MPTALAGSHDTKAYGASSGVVGDDNFWAVTMARSHGSTVPLPHRALGNFSITRKRETRYNVSRFHVAFSSTISAGGGGARRENATHGVVFAPWAGVFADGSSRQPPYLVLLEWTIKRCIDSSIDCFVDIESLHNFY
ncbi:hypothetical protein Tco_0787858 [Tanacetum coccineum]